MGRSASILGEDQAPSRLPGWAVSSLHPLHAGPVRAAKPTPVIAGSAQRACSSRLDAHTSAVPDCMHGLCTAADTTCAIEDRATQLALYGPRPNCLREALMHGFAVAFAQAELHLGMTMIVAALFMLAVLRLALSGTVLV